MNNTTTVHARIDIQLKQNVELILEQLGLTHSDAIKLFYKQIELNHGIPFELKISEKTLAEIKLLSELNIAEESSLENGWLDIESSKKKLDI